MCVNISSIKRIYSNQSHYFPDIRCIILAFDKLRATSHLVQWEVLWKFCIFSRRPAHDHTPVCDTVTLKCSFCWKSCSGIEVQCDSTVWGWRRMRWTDNSVISRLYVCSNLEQRSVNKVQPPKGVGWMQSSPQHLGSTMWNGNSTPSETVERIQCLRVWILHLSVLVKQRRAAV